MSERFHQRPGAIAELLDDAVDEARVRHIWLGSQRRVREHERRRSTRRVTAVAALAVVVAAGVGLGLGERGPGPELRLADGRLPYAHTSAGAEALLMADGSSVRMAPNTTWVPLRNEEGRFESELAEGRIDVHVRPGGPRRWVIEAGPTRVEVVGTRFVVERSGRTVEVSVSRGRVRVDDPRLEGGARVLRAGERARMADPPAPAPTRPASAPAPAPAPPPLAPTPPRRDWQRLASEGEHAEAYEALGRDGLRAEVERADAAHLMLLADVARLSGHPAEAVEPLERLLAHAPDDPRAPLAAVVLGRTEMDRLNRPERARRAFERALELGVPAALRGDVEARLRRLDASR